LQAVAAVLAFLVVGVGLGIDLGGIFDIAEGLGSRFGGAEHGQGTGGGLRLGESRFDDDGDGRQTEHRGTEYLTAGELVRLHGHFLFVMGCWVMGGSPDVSIISWESRRRRTACWW
jgi:hypothetical protein